MTANTAATDLSRAFAEDMVRLGRGALPPSDQEQARRLLLDLLGVSLCGSQLPWTQSMVAFAASCDGSGKAPVIGTKLKVAPFVAALVNGTAGHGYELDDTHDQSMSHPGAVVIPAALAVAAEQGSSQADLLQAIAAGYETMARVGMAANASHVIAAGFHPTALFGSFGAATAAGLLLDLDAAQLAQAWGHALSLTGGSMQFSDEPAGTMVKRAHAGYAAQHGVLAAGLAKHGVSAPMRALDGKYGFLALYGRQPKPERLRRDPAEPLQIHAISMKPYSCCRLFHSLIDALEEATDGYRVPIDGATRIMVRGPALVFDQHMMRRPTSVMAAQYSLPYVVGATLAYGPTRYDSYGEGFHQDRRILALADVVQGEADPEIEKHYPAHFGTSVEISLADGSRRKAQVMDSRGTPARPMSNGDIKAKAAGLATPVVAGFDVEAASKAIWSGADARALAGMFGA
jgi:2-methylcitrate dehydratase PrpD